jgi:hypothetical protein
LGQAFHGFFYLGLAWDDPIKGWVYLGCLWGAPWAGSVVGGPDSWRLVRSNLDLKKHHPSSNSACHPAAANASLPESQLLSDQTNPPLIWNQTNPPLLWRLNISKSPGESDLFSLPIVELHPVFWMLKACYQPGSLFLQWPAGSPICKRVRVGLLISWMQPGNVPAQAPPIIILIRNRYPETIPSLNW